MQRPSALFLIALIACCLPPLSADQETLAPAKIHVGGATINVRFGAGKLDLPRAAVLDWITTAARAVSAYFGRFPVPNPKILVRPAEGRSGIFWGTTWGFNGGFTRISVGQQTDQRELNGDWMMTHELVHMAFPDVEGEDREHHWIEEGMATYVEPIARCQIGNLSIERVWGDMARYMPQGEPEPGDQGLDNTHTWGRTYWGGALYWLMADIQIHQQSGNRKGLQDAMRGIVAAGGTIDHDWPIERVLQAGDRAIGCTVLADLYRRMKNAPVEVDLNDLWQKLGISVDGHTVTFNDNAPLARIRKAITVPRKPAQVEATKHGAAEADQ